MKHKLNILHILLLLLPLLLFLSACASTPVSKDAPAWVNSVNSVYSRQQYVAAVGFDSKREIAEKNALANLASFFGQSLQVERTAISSYQQAVVNGVTDSWIDTAEMRSTIKTAASMENLLGAEITEVWHDPRGIYYAAAVMDKQRSARLYNEVINANLNIIKNLVSMTAAEKNTINGFIRYRFAAAVADINVSYASIVRLLDASPPAGILSGDHYRLEAQNIAKVIPIGIRLSEDRQTRIFGAFAKCFTDFGFETTSGNSRYVLNVNLSLQPVTLTGNQNVFSRIEIAANLTDTSQNLVLLPFNFNTREGHTTQAEAENRCIAAAEKHINEEYAALLNAYFTRLVPK